MGMRILFTDRNKESSVMVKRVFEVARRYGLFVEVINVRDGECEILRAYDVQTTPTFVKVTTEGKRFKATGVLSEQEIDEIL